MILDEFFEMGGVPLVVDLRVLLMKLKQSFIIHPSVLVYLSRAAVGVHNAVYFGGGDDSGGAVDLATGHDFAGFSGAGRTGTVQKVEGEFLFCIRLIFLKWEGEMIHFNCSSEQSYLS